MYLIRENTLNPGLQVTPTGNSWNLPTRVSLRGPVFLKFPFTWSLLRVNYQDLSPPFYSFLIFIRVQLLYYILIKS